MLIRQLFQKKNLDINNKQNKHDTDKENPSKIEICSPGPKYQGIRELTTSLTETAEILKENEIIIEDYQVQVSVLKANWISAYQENCQLKRQLAKYRFKSARLKQENKSYLQEIESAESFYLETTVSQRETITTQLSSLHALQQTIRWQKLLLFFLVVIILVYQ